MGKTSIYQSLEMENYHPKVVAYYFKQWDDFYMPFHAHDAVEIMYVITGQCKVIVEDTELYMKKGHFVLIDSRIPHRLLVTDEDSCRMLNLEFVINQQESNFPSLKELALNNHELHELVQLHEPFFFIKDLNNVYYTLKNLVLELDNSKQENKLMVQLMISELLLLVARNIVESREKPPHKADIYIKQVIDYIHENYDYDIRVKELASIVHLHPSYLHRVFKEVMGCTIMDYLTQVRIEKAKMLLRQSDIPVTEISSFVGINSCQYFSNLFKKCTGSTPLRYRQETIDER